MVDYGAELVGVAEAVGSIYNPNGINPDDLLEYKNAKGGILGYPKAEKEFDDESAIYLPCDMFIPAALE